MTYAQDYACILKQEPNDTAVIRVTVQGHTGKASRVQLRKGRAALVGAPWRTTQHFAERVRRRSNVVKSKRTKVGLLQMVEEASSKLDPTQKAEAERSVKEVIHAITVRDQKAAEKAVNNLARVFLRMPICNRIDE